MSGSERSGIVSQLAEGMSWLHLCRIAHLDLRPGNLLWEPRCCHLMLIDFGMALKCQEDGALADDIKPFTAVTAKYRPPELWKSKLSKDITRWRVDAWSFGATMVEIFVLPCCCQAIREPTCCQRCSSGSVGGTRKMVTRLWWPYRSICEMLLGFVVLQRHTCGPKCNQILLGGLLVCDRAL